MFHVPPPVSLSRDRPAVGLASNEDLAKSTLELPWDVGTGALAQKRTRVVAACGLNLKCPFPVMCLVERSTNYAELCPCPLPSVILWLCQNLTSQKYHQENAPCIGSFGCSRRPEKWIQQMDNMSVPKKKKHTLWSTKNCDLPMKNCDLMGFNHYKWWFDGDLRSTKLK